jgi:2-epi-5-epi-valiolone synthase
MGVICDFRLFQLIEDNSNLLLKGAETPEVIEIITRAISSMLHELEANPFEWNLRRLPDFGHEFGHMLESLSHYRLRHGEAVAVGMALSCKLANYAGYLAACELERILSALRAIGLPIWDSACEADRLWTGLRDDVLPHKGGQLHLVVPASIGVGTFIDSLDEISPAMLRQACSELRMCVA